LPTGSEILDFGFKWAGWVSKPINNDRALRATPFLLLFVHCTGSPGISAGLPGLKPTQ
jgi:hypothetical protein